MDVIAEHSIINIIVYDIAIFQWRKILNDTYKFCQASVHRRRASRAQAPNRGSLARCAACPQTAGAAGAARGAAGGYCPPLSSPLCLLSSLLNLQ